MRRLIGRSIGFLLVLGLFALPLPALAAHDSEHGSGDVTSGRQASTFVVINGILMWLGTETRRCQSGFPIKRSVVAGEAERSDQWARSTERSRW